MRQVLNGSEPILLACHDAEDHTWQFIGTSDADLADAKLVCLERITQLDPSVLELADLPPGWWATRAKIGDQWKRFAAPAENEG
jgi:hypothetical protein